MVPRFNLLPSLKRSSFIQQLVKHHSTQFCRDKIASPMQQRWQSVCAHPSAQLVQHSWQLLFAHLWPLIALFSLSDGVILLLTRCSHRVTNEGALWCSSCNITVLGKCCFISTLVQRLYYQHPSKDAVSINVLVRLLYRLQITAAVSLLLNTRQCTSHALPKV